MMMVVLICSSILSLPFFAVLTSAYRRHRKQQAMSDRDETLPASSLSELSQQMARELESARQQISRAADVPALQRAADETRQLMRRLIGQLDPEPLTRQISALNDALTQRVIDIHCTAAQPQANRWCWISLGSEGRQEQTFSSDQDNGIVFADDGSPVRMRDLLLPLAQRINRALDACGFPLCSGNIMAGNADWCLSLHEWKQRFGDWINEGDPQSLLNAAIFFDLRPLYGSALLAGTLTDWLARNASDHPRFLFLMAENALRREPPLGLLRDFIVEHEGRFPGTIDLKVNAATLFIDAARIYGLACGIHESNTAQRLRLAAQSKHLSPSDAEAWIRAFHFIQLLRLKHQQRCAANGMPMHNHLDPHQLGRSERRQLLQALRAARTLQRRLAQDFLRGGPTVSY